MVIVLIIMALTLIDIPLLSKQVAAIDFSIHEHRSSSIINEVFDIVEIIIIL